MLHSAYWLALKNPDLNPRFADWAKDEAKHEVEQLERLSKAAEASQCYDIVERLRDEIAALRQLLRLDEDCKEKNDE